MRRERRLNGVVYTPQLIADEITRLAIKRLGHTPKRVLEPSVGEGAFISALEKCKVDLESVHAIDIAKNTIDNLSIIYPSLSTDSKDFLGDDVLKYEKFQLIIGNPPFIKRHNFTSTVKKNIDCLNKNFSQVSKNIKNTWVGFLLKSVSLLEDDGVLAFILPYEFMLTDYGREAQEFIRTEFKSVEIYIPEKKAFPDIDQDAVFLIASNKGNAGLYYKRVDELLDLSLAKSTRYSAKKASKSVIERVGFLLKSETKNLLISLEEKLNPVGDFCSSAPGVVTGANDFFVIDKYAKEEFGLDKWVKPIIRKKSFIPSKAIFDEKDMNDLFENHPALLTDFETYSEKDETDGVRRFFEEGKKQRILTRFKIRTRDPWYVVPRTLVGDGFIFKRAHNFHQIYINEAKVLTTDAAYQIYMKEGYAIEDLSFSFHNSLTATYAEAYGRFYGGGVLELTPKEFRTLPIHFQNIEKSRLVEFIECFPEQHNFSPTQFQFGDRCLKKSLRLSSEELNLIHEALYTLRKHRLRHGGRKN